MKLKLNAESVGGGGEGMGGMGRDARASSFGDRE